jgi:flavin-dependent dehydrogenase
VRGVTSVGVRGRIHSDTALDEFVGRLALQPEVASPIAVHRRILPASGSLEKSAHDGALAVGSTAGQASQVALGSLRYSLGCGDIAGKIAVEAITEGNVSRARLAEYENLWGEEFGRELESYSALHHSLAALSDRGWDELLGILGGSPPLGRAFLDLLLAREPGRAFEVLLGEESVRAVLRLAGTSARFRGGG